MSTSMNRRLRQLFVPGAGLIMPGAGNALAARVIEATGHPVMMISGAAVANNYLGQPDLGLVSLSELVNHVAAIRNVVNIPIIVDADTGFGNALNTQRTVREFERAGAAMIQLEDQTFPKRCGHLDGKGVVPVAEMCGKLKAALDARRSADTLILARTDAVAVEGFDAALERAEAYLACGVDALFVEAVRSPEQMAAACGRFAPRIPMLANMVEGGKTPVKSADELGAIGYRIVIFPGGTARAVAHTLQRYYASLHTHRTTTPMREQMLDFDQLNGVIGTTELLEQGRRYG
jgi:2-methylisocitrate lyase-like PEP mutase family enzyme